jgi:hypothetical protein
MKKNKTEFQKGFISIGRNRRFQKQEYSPTKPYQQ